MLEAAKHAVNKKSRGEIVTDFFRLIEKGRPKDGLKYFSAECVQHNPYVHGGMAALFDSMAAVQREQKELSQPGITIKHMVEQGDILVAHTQILFAKSNPAQGGLRQAHVFRFGRADEIVEYWDITQMISSDMPHAANAF